MAQSLKVFFVLIYFLFNCSRFFYHFNLQELNDKIVSLHTELAQSLVEVW